MLDALRLARERYPEFDWWVSWNRQGHVGVLVGKDLIRRVQVSIIWQGSASGTVETAVRALRKCQPLDGRKHAAGQLSLWEV